MGNAIKDIVRPQCSKVRHIDLSSLPDLLRDVLKSPSPSTSVLSRPILISRKLYVAWQMHSVLFVTGVVAAVSLENLTLMTKGVLWTFTMGGLIR